MWAEKLLQQDVALLSRRLRTLAVLMDQSVTSMETFNVLAQAIKL